MDKKKRKTLVHVDETLKELEQHGTSELPLEVYEDNCEVYKAIYTHWHKEMEIVYITKGKGLFRLNKEVIHVAQGDIVLIGKEMIHYIRTDRKNILHFKSLVFDLSILYGQIGDLCQRGLIEPLIKKEIEIAHVIRINDPCYEAFREIYLKIIRSYREKEPYFYVELKSLFFGMFFILLKEHYILPAEGVDHKTVSSIKMILDYLESHYQEDLSVGHLAELVHYSDSYLMKVFKQYMGKTLISYMNELRIEKSKYLLIHSNLSITEISSESGYNNSSYYIRKFQELQGITPQKFRKLNQNL